MKLNQKLIVAAITISLFLGFTGMARMRANDILRIAEKSSVEIQIAQNDFSTENDSDILYFGVPEERSPYGFIKTDSKIVSYCKELISYLRNYQEKKFNFKEISVNVAERQKLLKQLSQTYPTNTEEEQKTVANEVIKRIKSDPKSMQRILSALKAGGTSALGQFLNHPAATFIIEALKDWQETKRD